MKEYIIRVEVDEDTVKLAAGTDNVLEAIEAEAGWMHDSGIFVKSVDEVNGRNVIKVTENNLDSLYWNPEGNIYINGEVAEGFSQSDIRCAMENGCIVEYREGPVPNIPEKPLDEQEFNEDERDDR